LYSSAFLQEYKTLRRDVSQLYSSVAVQTDEDAATNTRERRQSIVPEFKSLTLKEQKLAKGLLLCICYAANIGGTGTLTGTGPNLVLTGVLETYVRESMLMSCIAKSAFDRNISFSTFENIMYTYLEQIGIASKNNSILHVWWRNSRTFQRS